MKATDLISKYSHSLSYNKAYLTICSELDESTWMDLGFQKDLRRHPNTLCMILKEYKEYHALLEELENIFRKRNLNFGMIKLCFVSNDFLEYHTWFVYCSTSKCIYSQTLIDARSFNVLSKCSEIF